MKIQICNINTDLSIRLQTIGWHHN